MDEQIFIYQPRILIFLDVLGFEEELKTFEKQGLRNRNRNGGIITSKKANTFVNVFKQVIGLINKQNCKSYLFTDNICLTFDPDSNPLLWTETFFIVSELFFKFAEIGYFLRGGVDYGLMLDEEDIAVGLPLVHAYKLERDKAIFPRILVSNNYVKQLNDLVTKNELDEDMIYFKDNFLMESCELTYINPFFSVIKYSDKVAYFNLYKRTITANLRASSKDENVFNKYRWLADEFNTFLTKYIENIDTIDQNIEIDEGMRQSLLKKLKEQSISYD